MFFLYGKNIIDIVAGGDSGELTPVSVNSEFEYNSHSPKVNADTKLTPANDESNSDKTDQNNTFTRYVEDVKGKNSFEEEGDDEVDEAEKTITTTVSAPRESIVGFFQNDELVQSSCTNSDPSSPDDSQVKESKQKMKKCKSLLSFTLEKN